MKEETRVMVQRASTGVWEEIKDVHALEISTKWIVELE